MRHALFRTLTVLLLLPVGFPASAEGEVYRFELVIFERPGAAPELAAIATDPDLGVPTVPPTTPARHVRGNLSDLPAAGKRLGNAVAALKRKGMRVLSHEAWRQVPVRRGSNNWYRVGNVGMSGLVRVARGRYLHLDAELRLGPDPRVPPLTMHRRFRSGELHYVDHPQVGILIQAERYQPVDSAANAAENASGEPKPARPLEARPAN